MTDHMTGAAMVTDQAPGALPNGTIIEKIGSKEGDAHPDGARGKVLGSVGPKEVLGHGKAYAYCVEWSDTPGVPIFVISTRVREVKT